MMMMVVGGGGRYPFTASQWQELELQALIFKYMVSGIPVPPDLILCIRRSLFVEPQTLRFLPHPPTVGWEAYQVGDGRKAVDPEPGRCRRTDGKKWRCSKDAFPDSKYCERHMHRGKSRSRKPVELSLATTPISSHFPPPPPLLSLQNRGIGHIQSSGLSHIGVCLWVVKQEEEKHYFVLGADFKAPQIEGEVAREAERPQNLRPFHCFLDEKPSRVVDSWLGMEVDQSKQAPDPKTRLSITSPVANHDMPVTAPQCYSGAATLASCFLLFGHPPSSHLSHRLPFLMQTVD
ncbi:hypothetical protein B296_00043869 [Ensete ventricosum]|uniref:Growth-regulating factor n=1 Tax=Ensete ventricosum TaxID=4639 RepID=A0A426XE40_ENSVE|nr:hypothetical protein B296_00043869 [Ensete ventricosum]